MDEDFVDFAAGVAAMERGYEAPCEHLSCDGTRYPNVLVCMACARLVRVGRQGIYSTLTILGPDEVKELLS